MVELSQYKHFLKQKSTVTSDAYGKKARHERPKPHMKLQIHIYN